MWHFTGLFKIRNVRQYACAIENLCTIRLSEIKYKLSHRGYKTDYSLTLSYQTCRVSHHM